MNWFLMLWLMPAMFIWLAIAYEWMFTDIVYTRSTIMATALAGLVPVFGLVVSMVYIGTKISDWIYRFIDIRGRG